MRLLFKALLAAAALIPATTAAIGQDSPREDGRRGRPDGGRGGQGVADARPFDGNRERPGGGGGEPRRDFDRADPQFRAPPAPDQRRPDDRRQWNRDDRPAPPQRGPRDGDWNRPRIDPGRGDGRGGWNQPAPRQWRDDRGAWNRTWRNDRRYDWDRYRAVNRNAYRLPRYYAPDGWSYGYRRFGIGAALGAALWRDDYWIADPWAYRLPEAYGPYRWVRYYGDALLVDIRTGRVVDAVYDIFW